MKTYIFAFGSHRAEFKDGLVATIFDGKKRYCETHCMTLIEAQTYLPDFVKKVEPGPAQVFMNCLSRPKPRGWNRVRHVINKFD